MKNYKKNFEILKKNHVYSEEMEHDACGVGLIASTEGKKSRKVVEYGIEALKAVWHRGAVDADGKTGDGAGIHVEIPKDFFIEKHYPMQLSLMPPVELLVLNFLCYQKVGYSFLVHELSSNLYFLSKYLFLHCVLML